MKAFIFASTIVNLDNLLNLVRIPMKITKRKTNRPRERERERETERERERERMLGIVRVMFESFETL